MSAGPCSLRWRGLAGFVPAGFPNGSDLISQMETSGSLLLGLLNAGRQGITNPASESLPQLPQTFIALTWMTLRLLRGAYRLENPLCFGIEN